MKIRNTAVEPEELVKSRKKGSKTVRRRKPRTEARDQDHPRRRRSRGGKGARSEGQVLRVFPPVDSDEGRAACLIAGDQCERDFPMISASSGGCPLQKVMGVRMPLPDKKLIHLEAGRRGLDLSNLVREWLEPHLVTLRHEPPRAA